MAAGQLLALGPAAGITGVLLDQLMLVSSVNFSASMRGTPFLLRCNLCPHGRNNHA